MLRWGDGQPGGLRHPPGTYNTPGTINVLPGIVFTHADPNIYPPRGHHGNQHLAKLIFEIIGS
jgi:hypothetical protein